MSCARRRSSRSGRRWRRPREFGKPAAAAAAGWRWRRYAHAAALAPRRGEMVALQALVLELTARVQLRAAEEAGAA